MELWEKMGWVHGNCRFAKTMSPEEMASSRIGLAFRVACKRARAGDADGIIAAGAAFFRRAVMEISDPTSNPLAKNPVDAIVSEIRPMLSREFEKVKSVRKEHPLLSADIARLTMMGFRMMQEKLRQRGIHVRDLVSLRTIVQDVVEELAEAQREVSMAVPGKARFMHDKPTRAVEDMAQKAVDRFTGIPKVPQGA